MMDRSKAPEVHEFGKLTYNDPQSIRLDNGTYLHIESSGEAEVCRLTVALPGGEAEAPKAGLANCAAQLLQEGTVCNSGEEIAQKLEFNGAWLLTAVSTHYTLVTLCCINDKFLEILPVIYDIINNPVFPESSFRQVIEKTASRFEIEREKVSVLADETLRKLAYGDDNPLSRAQNPEVIRELTRKEISDFHFSRLNSEDTHIFFSGLLNEGMINAVVKMFSRPCTDGHYNFTPLIFNENRRVRQEHVEKINSKQSAVKMMIPTIGRDNSDFVALRLTVTALGGYFGSRLMLNIREDKGLTYGISSALLGYKDKGFIMISTQTDSRSVDEVIRLIKVELERMKDASSYTRDELKRLSGMSLLSLANVLETPFSRMEFYQTRFLADTPPDYFERQEMTARMVMGELLAAQATKYFDLSRLIIVTAGA